MIFIEITYCIMAFICVFLLYAILGQWVIRNGVKGPESKAKAIAMMWRFSEAAIALIVLYVLWKPILHLGDNGGLSVEGGGTAFFIASLFTLVFGGMYVGGSLFAAVTVTMGDQMGYFREMLERIKDN